MRKEEYNRLNERLKDYQALENRIKEFNKAVNYFARKPTCNYYMVKLDSDFTVRVPVQYNERLKEVFEEIRKDLHEELENV